MLTKDQFINATTGIVAQPKDEIKASGSVAIYSDKNLFKEKREISEFPVLAAQGLPWRMSRIC